MLKVTHTHTHTHTQVPENTGRQVEGDVPNLHPPKTHVCLPSVVLLSHLHLKAAGECAARQLGKPLNVYLAPVHPHSSK